MFWNLIKNSIKAAPEGGTITIDFDQSQRNEIHLKIGDTGIIPDDEEGINLDESAQSGFYSGEGIGMAVVRRIIDDYNGKIRVRPGGSQGREVVIVLPKSQAKSDSTVRL